MANVLQSFHILFESNVDKVRQGEEELKKVDKDLEGQLNRTGEAAKLAGKKMVEANVEAAGSFAVIDEAVDRMKENALDAFKEIATSFIGIFAVSALVDKIGETTEMVEHLGQVSKELGVNVSDLDAWDRAVTKSGGTAEGFQASLRGLNGRLAAMGAGGAGAKRTEVFLKELGIQGVVTHGQIMPLPDLLLKLADSFQHMDRQKSAGIGQKLGLDPATILLLQSGRKAVTDMIEEQKKLGTVTQKDVEIAAAFEDQWKDTKQIFTEGAIGMGDVVLPILTYLLKEFETFYFWLSDHTELVKGFFIGVAGAITVFYLPAMLEAAAATLELLAPFILVGAAVAGFALLYEDLMDYLAGKNSVIGELVKKWPELGVVIHDVADAVKDIGKVFKAAFKLIVESFTDPKKAMADFKSDMAAVVTSLEKFGGTVLNTITQPFVDAWNSFNKFTSALLNFPNVADVVAQGIGKAFEAVFKQLWQDGEDTVKAFQSIIDIIQKAIGWIDNLLGLKDKAVAFAKALVGDETPKQKAQDAAVTANSPLAREEAAGVATPGGLPARKAGGVKFDDADYPVIGSGPLAVGSLADLPGRPGQPVLVTAAEANPEPPPGDPRKALPVAAVAAGQDHLAVANSSAVAAMTPAATKAATSVTNNTNVTATVNVQTQSTDPDAIAKAASDHLATQTRAAIAHHQDGIAG